MTYQEGAEVDWFEKAHSNSSKKTRRRAVFVKYVGKTMAMIVVVGECRPRRVMLESLEKRRAEDPLDPRPDLDQGNSVA